MAQPSGNPFAFASDEVLRHARSRVVASLAATFGAEHLELVEDAVQDALVSALKAWTHVDAPADPTSWLYRAARNRATDILRRERRHTELDDHLIASQSEDLSEPLVRDNELRMLLMCCHPVLPPTARVALALSIVAGLSAPQIARALLVAEPAARQTLVRAKRKLRDESVELALAGAPDLEGRVDAALSTLYLMFNEGYSASEGERLVRPELCHEAIRMCGVLLDSPLTAAPQVHALGALFFFQAARLNGRMDGDGNPLTLADQDRTRWDHRLIAIAFEHLEKAGTGTTLSTYHLEAEIASYHARAASVDSTDWDSIVRAYDSLIRINPSPIISLNRAVAIAQRDGVGAALAELEALESVPSLATYPFFHTTRGQLLVRAGRHAESRAAFAHALTLATSLPVHRFVAARLGLEPVSKNTVANRL
ncbi:MAG TPA: sigma-70 family RNA polymerase sigma factor [Gemmatimonadaceae bacterium]|nr:sigma-70 family RNA polymerase sigma factor [Gemmatimonadaceae bacterium]